MLSSSLASLLGVSDPFSSSSRCGLTRLLPVDPTSFQETTHGLALAMAKLTLVWCLLWYLLALIAKFGMLGRLPPSYVAKENTAFFVGQKCLAFCKVSVVSALANSCLWAFRFKPVEHNFLGGPAIEIAGLLFTTYEIADLILGLLHGLMDLVYVVHHLLHIMLGLIIRGHCVMGLVAALLMSQASSASPAPLSPTAALHRNAASIS